jgi:hypothetical protein
MAIWGRVVGGVLLILIGVVWILQGTGTLGASGGMNGQMQWAVIGVVVLVGGLVLLVAGLRRLRAGRRG